VSCVFINIWFNYYCVLLQTYWFLVLVTMKVYKSWIGMLLNTSVNTKLALKYLQRYYESLYFISISAIYMLFISVDNNSYFAPIMVRNYCDEYVCVSVCPRGYLRNHTWSLPNCLCMLPMAVTWSSSSIIALCFELLVLWMTSCFFL